MSDPFPNWKPGDQFCMYCKKIVKFPHQCPELLDKKEKPTHNWTQCLEKGHEDKHKIDARSESNRYLKCSKCGWHVPKEYIDNGAIYPCPGASGPTPFTETTYTGVSKSMTCPVCKTPLKAFALGPNQVRYYCPSCNPLE